MGLNFESVDADMVSTCTGFSTAQQSVASGVPGRQSAEQCGDDQSVASRPRSNFRSPSLYKGQDLLLESAYKSANALWPTIGLCNLPAKGLLTLVCLHGY